MFDHPILKASVVVAILSIVGFTHDGLAGSQIRVGQPAPAFSGVSNTGSQISLSDYRGKTVVLEWTNHQCPYVRKHYSTDNMQAAQKQATSEGVVWISVVSSAPGREGFVAPDESQRLTRERGASPTEVVLDSSGEIGRLYNARVTPHMFVIDGSGTLVYMGGIDDRPSARRSDIDGATNYVLAALADIKASRNIAQAVTRAYGCSVKYGS